MEETNREYLEKNFKHSVIINKCSHIVSWGLSSCLQFMDNTRLENWLDSECSIKDIEPIETELAEKNILISHEDLCTISFMLDCFRDMLPEDNSNSENLDDAIELVENYLSNPTYGEPKCTSKEKPHYLKSGVVTLLLAFKYKQFIEDKFNYNGSVLTQSELFKIIGDTYKGKTIYLMPEASKYGWTADNFDIEIVSAEKMGDAYIKLPAPKKLYED